MTKPEAKLKLRITFAPDIVLGPGKAQLLALIRDTGSISAAGRAMGMSYKRAWMLVEAMNSTFAAPVVSSARGGAQGGGAHLTEMGDMVLAQLMAFEAKATAATTAEVATLQNLLRDTPERK
ncbi:MAG: hypothetical protein V9G14_12855 [Cypionkella sp.]